jgi:pimeloyl-ACP methyl ester carboxylesterase
MSAPRLILLPGLGADARLFAPQAAKFSGLDVPDWIPPHKGENLESFARRMMEAVHPSGEYVLGGVSFGGMVASEMARHLRPRALLLIASAATGTAVPGHGRFVIQTALRLGIFARRSPRPFWPALGWAFGATTPAARELLSQFFESAPPSFIQWGLEALLRWKPTSALVVPVFHIHGATDRLIPSRRVRATAVVAGGGHLINVTHADEVNAFVRRVLDRE